MRASRVAQALASRRGKAGVLGWAPSFSAGSRGGGDLGLGLRLG